MEFEEMQIIWNTQNDEKMYAINEAALYAQIRRKGHSIERKVTLVEAIMVGANLIAGVILILDALGEIIQMDQVIMAALYLAYSVVALARRLTRRTEVVRFDHTLLGELEKAIWNTDYLIRQSKSMILWYLLPLLLVFSFLSLFNGKLLLAAGLMLILLPATYFGGRWEISRFYLPKKRSLEALRETLTAQKP
jgi:hypothetical protein